MKYPNFKVNNFNMLPLLLLTIITWYFALKKNPFEYTLSMIGNRFTFRLDFIVWGILTSIFLTIYIFDLYKKSQFHSQTSFGWLFVGIASLVISVLTPVLEQLPLSRVVHNFFSLVFGIALIVSIFIFVKFIHTVDERMYRKATKYLSIIIGGTFLCIVFFGITGIFEIYFITSLGMLLYFIGRNLPLEKFEELFLEKK